MRESLTARTLKGAAWIGGASVARLALRVVSVAILARLLTPHEYGVVAGALIAMDFAAMIYGMGLAPTLVQRKEVRPDHVATAFSSTLFVAVLASVGMWLAAPLIAELLQIPELTQILKVLAWLTPFGAFSLLCEALLARNLRTKSIALRPLFSFTIATFLVAIPLAYAGFGYWSLVAMQATETIAAALALGLTARRLLVRPGFSRQGFYDLWPLSLGFTLNQPFIYLGQNADRIFIGRFLGAASLGLYTRASFITTTAANLFGNIARLSMFPVLAQVQDDREKLRTGLLKSLSIIALMTLPASAFCIVFADELVDLLLGDNWSAAAVPFAILSGALYFRLAWRACAAVFEGIGRPTLLTALHIFRGTALVVAIWWTHPYGLTAICWVVLAITVLVLAIMFAIVKHVIDMPFHQLIASHVHPILISATIIGIGMAVKLSMANLGRPILLFVMLVMVIASLSVLALRKPAWVLGAYNVALVRDVRSHSSMLPIKHRARSRQGHA
jgi:O-antigen/teichoic acid export membrane protein